MKTDLWLDIYNVECVKLKLFMVRYLIFDSRYKVGNGR